MQEYIIESLQNLAVDINSIKVNPRNTRSHDDKNLEAIKNSLKAYGQRKPIVVNKNTMLIEAGNGTYEAARKLEWPKIAVVFVDDDESMAKGYEVMDNRSSDLSAFDMPTLKDALLELDSGEFDLEKMVGFDAKDMEDLMTQFHVEDEEPKEKEVDENIETKNKCPKCGYEY